MNVINSGRWLASQPMRVSSASAIAENEHGDALIVKATYKSYWTFPGGIIEPEETPREAAARELREEVGILRPSHDFEFVAVVDRKSDITQTYLFLFRLTSALPTDQHVRLQGSEISEYVFVSKEQVLRGDRHYNEAILAWARGHEGYLEHFFDA